MASAGFTTNIESDGEEGRTELYTSCSLQKGKKICVSSLISQISESLHNKLRSIRQNESGRNYAYVSRVHL